MDASDWGDPSGQLVIQQEKQKTAETRFQILLKKLGKEN